ncbi:Succinate dehydrogenase subunit 8A [Carex littledalei]|uniref:Succinate dehydrogenase subunit 8A n=1 Tax=Carex littledalei TaxID=544730 RepID=A0A833VRW6_9POAL|nr:Succinate dehydrogenase subunit 8A [Carex littledalei]
MIYRRWSLLTSTIVIWGGIATAGIAGFHLFGAKEKFREYMRREGEKLRHEDRVMMAKSKGD